MENLSYQILRSKKRKRTLSLRIDDQGNVLVYVPYRTTESEIKSFISAKRDWIEKNLQEFGRRNHKSGKPRRFVSGEEFLYLGDKYQLQTCERNGRSALVLLHGTFQMDVNRQGEVKELFVEWYRKRACEIIHERINHYQQKLNLSLPLDVRITSAQSRYGSCSAKNRLSFSWRLIMAPYPVIDYVIIHELSHIKHKNHSKRFWSAVEEILPDYRQYRIWLNENDHLLKL